MNSGDDRTTDSLREAINQLKDCQPLVDRLKAHGVTIQLTSQEIKNLQNFENMLSANYSDSQWSYLRVASGLQLSGIAVLSTCLARFLAQQHGSKPGV